MFLVALLKEEYSCLVVPVAWEAGWAPKRVCVLRCGEGKTLASAGARTPVTQ
jgi:hypothetical protein